MFWIWVEKSEQKAVVESTGRYRVVSNAKGEIERSRDREIGSKLSWVNGRDRERSELVVMRAQLSAIVASLQAWERAGRADGVNSRASHAWLIGLIMTCIHSNCPHVRPGHWALWRSRGQTTRTDQSPQPTLSIITTISIALA